MKYGKTETTMEQVGGSKIQNQEDNRKVRFSD